MKLGRTLESLAKEIERQADSKRDLVADTRRMRIVPAIGDAGNILMKVSGVEDGSFAVSTRTHRQIGEWAKIPAKYYDRMHKETPDLLVANVNRWFDHQPASRMVRCLDGGARAFLSDKYRRLDNYDLLATVMPVLMDFPGLSVESCEVTESKLYLKVLIPALTTELRVGQTISFGLQVANSEVGDGRLTVDPLSRILQCLNGATHTAYGVGRNHVGKAVSNGGNGLDDDSDDNTMAFWQDDTMKADEEAFFLKVRDVVRGTMTNHVMDKIVGEMRQSMDAKITGDIPAAVTELSNRKGFNETEKSNIFRHLISGADLSLYGLANAVTRTAEDIDDYDRASELERIGGSMFGMSKTEWNAIGDAAPEGEKVRAARSKRGTLTGLVAGLNTRPNMSAAVAELEAELAAR